MEFWSPEGGPAAQLGVPKAKPQQEDRGHITQMQPCPGGACNDLPARGSFSAGAIPGRLNNHAGALIPIPEVFLGGLSERAAFHALL